MQEKISLPSNPLGGYQGSMKEEALTNFKVYKDF